MNSLFSSMSLGLYSFFVLFVGCVFIFSIIDMKKKKPGHPFINALYFLLFWGLYTIPYRIIEAKSKNTGLVSIFGYSFWVLTIVTIIALVYFAYVAYKRGFLDEKGKRLMKNTVLPCTIMVVIGVVFIVVLYMIKIRR